MNDDLARFPTPKEAFKQRRPAHVSSAFDDVQNIPALPHPPRMRNASPTTVPPNGGGPLPLAHTQHVNNNSNNGGYYSTPATPEMTASQRIPYRTFSGPQYGSYQQTPPVSQQQYRHQVAAQQQQPQIPHNQYNQYVQQQSALAQRGAAMPPPTMLSNTEIRPHSHPNAHNSGFAQMTNNQEPRRVARRPVRTTGDDTPLPDSIPHSYSSPQNISSPRARGVHPPLHSNSSPSLNGSLPPPTSSSPSPVVSSAAAAANAASGLPAKPAATADLRSLFDEVDKRKNGYLTERELSKALVNGDYTLFDAHTVRLMMKMFDRDGDGAIYFAEFGQLWKYLHDWRQVFDKFDTDHSERISLEEFFRALAAFGYTLSATCVRFLFNAGSKLNRHGQREMSFDMFVQSCISIKSITDTFKRYDTDRDGYVTMGFEDFLIETTKLH